MIRIILAVPPSSVRVVVGILSGLTISGATQRQCICSSRASHPQPSVPYLRDLRKIQAFMFIRTWFFSFLWRKVTFFYCKTGMGYTQRILLHLQDILFTISIEDSVNNFKWMKNRDFPGLSTPIKCVYSLFYEPA